jgi:PAS domain S-box-containing protein
MGFETRFERDLIFDILEKRITFLEFIKTTTEEFLALCHKIVDDEKISLEECFQGITKFIGTKVDVAYAGILLVDDVAKELVPYSFYSKKDPRKLDNFMKTTRIKLGTGITGQSVARKEILLVNDVTKDPNFIRGPFEDTASEIAVPIKSKNKVVGVLDIQDSKKDRFKKDLISLLDNFARMIACIIETKVQFDRANTLVMELEKETQNKVKALEESEEAARLLLENASDAILTIDPNFNISWANKAAHELFRAQHLPNINITKFIKKGHVYEFYKRVQELLENKKFRPVKTDFEVKNPFGGLDTISVEITASLIPQKSGEPRIELILRDITRQAIIEKYREKYTEELEKIVIERTKQVKDFQRVAVLAIGNIAESIDQQTGNHLIRIRHYSRILAEELRKNPKFSEEIDDEYIELIYDLSPLHDIGKVAIKDELLAKESNLTPEEYEEVKKHATIGADALKKAAETANRPALFAVGELISRHHHQHWDGTGYPPVWINNEFRPLRGDEIPLSARIITLADVYDALTSKRAYKDAGTHEDAKKYMIEQSGKIFDPDIVNAFLAREEDFINVREKHPD